MAVGQAIWCRLIDRFREQAQLLQVFWLGSGFGVWHQSLWEQSLLAMAVGQSVWLQLTDHFREQAQLLHGWF
ncbi:hypothetical protein BI292_21950 [Pseudomonas sp. 43NM1]|nr:hypothetical protein BI292_21950 [Pseudomonas sp. 43NM1]